MRTEVVELNHADGFRLLDKVARRKLSMSAEEFLKAHDEGRLDREDPAVLDVEILIPFAR
jgi:hypothetical protein